MEQDSEKTWNWRKKRNGKLGKTKDIEETAWENQEICRKETLEKTVGTQEKFEKKTWNGGKGKALEKARNLEAIILKKLRIRSSSESIVRWSIGSRQSMQGDEWYRSRSGEGLLSKDKSEKNGTC